MGEKYIPYDLMLKQARTNSLNRISRPYLAHNHGKERTEYIEPQPLRPDAQEIDLPSIHKIVPVPESLGGFRVELIQPELQK